MSMLSSSASSRRPLYKNKNKKSSQWRNRTASSVWEGLAFAGRGPSADLLMRSDLAPQEVDPQHNVSSQQTQVGCFSAHQ